MTVVYEWHIIMVCNYLILAVADSLPIAITDEDAEKNPEFCKLLDSLAYRLSYSGTTRTLDEQLNVVRYLTSC